MKESTAPSLKTYVFFFNKKQADIKASSLLDAKEKAVQHFNPPKSQRHMVHGMLAADEKGNPIIHTPDF